MDWDSTSCAAAGNALALTEPLYVPSELPVFDAAYRASADDPWLTATAAWPIIAYWMPSTITANAKTEISANSTADCPRLTRFLGGRRDPDVATLPFVLERKTGFVVRPFIRTAPGPTR